MGGLVSFCPLRQSFQGHLKSAWPYQNVVLSGQTWDPMLGMFIWPGSLETCSRACLPRSPSHTQVYPQHPKLPLVPVNVPRTQLSSCLTSAVLPISVRLWVLKTLLVNSISPSYEVPVPQSEIKISAEQSGGKEYSPFFSFPTMKVWFS